MFWLFGFLVFWLWLLALLKLCFIYMAGTVCRGDGRRGKPDVMMGGDDWDDDWSDWDGSTFWSERRSRLLVESVTQTRVILILLPA